MIYRLQRKFILICTFSVLAVVTLIFAVMLVLNISSMNKNMDILADRISEGGGRFPGAFDEESKNDKLPPRNDRKFDFITPETPFSTRHFTVLLDDSGNVIKTFTESIYAISDEQAVAYAQEAVSENDARGWISNYRYKVFSDKFGQGVVFVDGSMSRSSLMQSMVISGTVLLACATLVVIVMIIFSKRAVKPIAESYEKQKQFITDANHELKTPLTLILANLDIAESELGKNEWLDDIRSEGIRMTELVNQLIALSRMDEEEYSLTFTDVAMGKMVNETVSEFAPLALSRGKSIKWDIDTDITYQGDEELLSRLVGILLDNAVKYCDNGGDIFVMLQRNRRIILTVENTYAAVNELELNRLFDRFYRADKARTFNGGYGIGLSMAKIITEKHKGDITVYKKDDNHIGFKVVLQLKN